MLTALNSQHVEAEPELPPLPPLQAQSCDASQGNEPSKPVDHKRRTGDPPDVIPNEQPDQWHRSENLGNPKPHQSSTNYRRMGDHPVGDTTLGPTRDDARKSSEPHQPSKRRRQSDSSGMEEPQSVKRPQYPANKNWSQREDEVLRNCMMRGGSLLEAVEELKSISDGQGRTYEACKVRWYRNLKPTPGTHEQPNLWDNKSLFSPHGARPDHRGRRGNFTRFWCGPEDAVLMREVAGDNTNWESVAVKVNGLCLVPSLPTPRTAASCKARWRRLRESDDGSEDSEDEEQHRDRSLSIPLDMPGTPTNLGDKEGVPFSGPTFTAGDSQHEHEELRNFLRTPRIPLRTYARTLPIRSPYILHSQPRISRPQPPIRLPSVPVANATATVTAQSGFPSMDKRTKQSDPLRHDVEQPPPGPGLSSDQPTPIGRESYERPVNEIGSPRTGQLPTGELQQQGPASQRDTQQSPPCIRPSEINAGLPTRVVDDDEFTQLDLLSFAEPSQHVPPHDVERPPPGAQLSANHEPQIDHTLPEWAVYENKFAHPGLLSLDEPSQHVLQRGAEPRQLSANQPNINPTLLERAVCESKVIKPSTSIAVCRMVARQVQRKYGPTSGYEEKLLDDIAKDLDIGWHRSTVIAVRYKELAGHDINPELFEMAENDVEAAQTATETSDRMLLFCMCVLSANPAPGQEEEESMMDDMEKLRRRQSEVRAGKEKWRCVAAHYRQLASKASAGLGDTDTITMGNRADVGQTNV